MSLSYNCPDSHLYFSLPVNQLNYVFSIFLYFTSLPPTVSSSLMHLDPVRAFLILQIRGHSHRNVRDAITQSASFEKERSMDPLSLSEAKGNEEEWVREDNYGRLNSKWTLHES